MFYGEYAHNFRGEESLDFDQAVELMRQFEELDHLQKQILNGRLTSVKPEQLRDLLGEEAGRSLKILLQLPGMVTEEGIVDIDLSGLNMTPKGMRSLAELAFGKS